MASGYQAFAFIGNNPVDESNFTFSALFKILQHGGFSLNQCNTHRMADTNAFTANPHSTG